MSKLYQIGKVSDWYSGETYTLSDIKLKSMQIAIIKCNYLNDVLVNLPTGFGKSMLFQYPASKLFNQCIIIFVPLRALLWDSIKQAQKFGISAAQIDDQTINQYQNDKKILQMYFLTPQKLFINQKTRNFVETLYQMKKIKKFVIDQAHCVSQWGSDFRPHYLELTKLKKLFPGVKLLAMSATIPPQAFQDLISKICMKNCFYFQASFNRTNLTYLIKQIGKSQVGTSIKNFLFQQNLTQFCGIIYCQTIKFAQQVSQQLSQLGLNCELFHSKVSQKKRWQIFKKFMNQQIKIIVATICFGMGVNKKNIRYVINVGISMTIQNYYQQSGRAGRDGKPSFCLLLSFPKDESALVFLTQESVKDKKMRDRKIQKIYKMKQYAKSLCCRKKFMFQLLGQKFTQEQCDKTCDYCLNKQFYQQKYQIIKQDVTEICKKIVSQLTKTQKFFTKNQIIQYLKGKQIKKKGFSLCIGNQIFGILKSKENPYIQAIIDKLIKLKLLIQYNTKGKGNFAKFNKFYKGNKTISLKHFTAIQIQLKKEKRIPVNMGKVTSSDQVMGDRFQKFISNKKNANKDVIDLTALQMKEVNEAKMVKAQRNLKFWQQLFDQSDKQQQTKIQEKKQKQQSKINQNLFQSRPSKCSDESNNSYLQIYSDQFQEQINDSNSFHPSQYNYFESKDEYYNQNDFLDKDFQNYFDELEEDRFQQKQKKQLTKSITNNKLTQKNQPSFVTASNIDNYQYKPLKSDGVYGKEKSFQQIFAKKSSKQEKIVLPKTNSGQEKQIFSKKSKKKIDFL